MSGTGVRYKSQTSTKLSCMVPVTTITRSVRCIRHFPIREFMTVVYVTFLQCKSGWYSNADESGIIASRNSNDVFSRIVMMLYENSNDVVRE